jgi:hypothetical protein
LGKLLIPLLAFPSDSIRPRPVKKLKGVLSLDGKRSFIDDQPIGISGIRGGIQWKQNFRVGGGIYFLNREMTESFKETDEQGEFRLRVQKLRFRYWALFYEKLVLKTKHWEVYLPLKVGPGKAITKIYHFNTYQRMQVRKVALLELSVGAEYRIWRYVGIGAGVGYRKILWANSNIRENLNAPIYSLRFKIFLDHLGEDLKWMYKRFYKGED